MPWGAMQCTASINFDTAQEPLKNCFQKNLLTESLKRHGKHTPSFFSYCRPFENLNSYYLLFVSGIVFASTILELVLCGADFCRLLQILGGVLAHNVIAISRLLDP